VNRNPNSFLEIPCSDLGYGFCKSLQANSVILIKIYYHHLLPCPFQLRYTQLSQIQMMMIYCSSGRIVKLPMNHQQQKMAAAVIFCAL
jgi:hypothetical protein